MKLADLRRFLVFADGELIAATNDAREAVASFDQSAADHRAIYTCQLHSQHHRSKPPHEWPADATRTQNQERQCRRLLREQHDAKYRRAPRAMP